MIRFGLCCLFVEHDIPFKTAKATYVLEKFADRKQRLEYIAKAVQINASSLITAIDTCSGLGIGSFRINSNILPLYTHPELHYQIEDLPNASEVLSQLKEAKKRAQEKSIRLTFHPDQFVVINSPNREIVKKSIEELEYHTMFAQLVGVDVVNIHAGGVYGDKKSALERFVENFSLLSKSAQKLLTIENDDKSYTPTDLLPVCNQLQIPLVYDVHHHRCNRDDLSIAEATTQALKTWNREPLFHISSPINGWEGKTPSRHHDYISVEDFPKEWLSIDPLTVEVEAKAKEKAVVKLLNELASYEKRNK